MAAQLSDHGIPSNEDQDAARQQSTKGSFRGPAGLPAVSGFELNRRLGTHSEGVLEEAGLKSTPHDKRLPGLLVKL